MSNGRPTTPPRRLADATDATLRQRRRAHGIPETGLGLLLPADAYARWAKGCRRGIGVGARRDLESAIVLGAPEGTKGYDNDHIVAAILNVPSTMWMEDEIGSTRVHLDDYLRMAGITVLTAPKPALA